MLFVVLLLNGCACLRSNHCTVAYPKIDNHYGHTYYGIEIKGTTK